MSVQYTTEAELDRMFFERIRLAVVAAGLLPDVTLYNSAASYETAKDTLLASLQLTLGDKARIVEVFGVGSQDAKREKTTNKITIERTGEKQGTIGGFPAFYFEQTDAANPPNANSKYDKKFYPDSSENVSYEVRVVAETSYYERILSAIVKNALHHRRHLPTIGANGQETTNRVFVNSNGSVDVSDKHCIEKLFKYTVEDVFLEAPTLIKANVPAMTTVNYFVYEDYDAASSLTNGTIQG